MSLFSLKGKVAVVSGGYGHLGSAMVEGLCEQGAEVVVLARSEEKFRDRFPEGPGKGISFIECDINSFDSIKGASERFKSKFSKLDILVNNAVSAAHWDGKQSSYSPQQEWEMSLKGSLVSVVQVTDAFFELLVSRQSSIINISSMYGVVSPDFRIYPKNQTPSPSYYGASKAALIQLTRHWACQWANNGIRVNCISPGPFPKPEVFKDEEFIRNLKSKVPLARLGKPEELKGGVVFLASDASSFMTGQNICIDGGWTAW